MLDYGSQFAQTQIETHNGERIRLKTRIRQLLDANEGVVEVLLDTSFIQKLKFTECMPQKLVEGELSARYSCAYQHEMLSERRLTMINSYAHEENSSL